MAAAADVKVTGYERGGTVGKEMSFTGFVRQKLRSFFFEVFFQFIAIEPYHF